MTDTPSAKRLDWAAIARRNWWIVLVAGIAGIVLAFAISDKTVTESVVATQRVTAPGSVGAVITPRAEAVVVAASVPSVLASAEESAGLKPGTLTGRAGAKIDATDKTSAVVTVRASSDAEARKEMAAFVDAIKAYIFRPQQTYLNVQEQAVKDLNARATALETRAAQLQAIEAKAPVADRALYEQAIQSVRSQQFSAQDLARTANQNFLTVKNSVSVDPFVQVSKRSSGGLEASVLLQGLLLGLAAGVAVVWVREWLRTRSSH